MNLCVPLRDRALLRLRGADARNLLQGQLTSDLRRLAPEQAQPSSCNTPKGRMLAFLHLLQHGEDVLLAVHDEVAAPLLQRLRLFVLRSKVVIDDASAEFAAFGLAGDGAAAALQALGLPAPATPFASARHGNAIVMRAFGEAPRWTLHAPRAEAAPLQAALGFADDGGAAWRALDIDAGVPVVRAATREMFIPQHANLDRLGAIAFDKGCYTGQEIVARIHYLGAVKRRMVLQRGAGAPPLPGAQLSGEPPAEVVDAVAEGDGWKGLVIAPAAAAA